MSKPWPKVEVFRWLDPTPLTPYASEAFRGDWEACFGPGDVLQEMFDRQIEKYRAFAEEPSDPEAASK